MTWYERWGPANNLNIAKQSSLEGLESRLAVERLNQAHMDDELNQDLRSVWAVGIDCTLLLVI